MKRAVIISAAVHLVVLLVFWQVSRALSRPVMRGYPRLITATLVAKPSAGQMQASPAPAVVTAAPARAVTPVSKTKKPDKIVPETKTQKTPPSTKPNVQRPSSGLPGSPGSSGKGSIAGSSSEVPGGHALKIDAPEFPFPHYLALVQYRIESNWEAPFAGQGERMATVYFKITRSGEIVDVKLEQSSGNFLFDQAATRAVYNANPLPPLPADSGLQTLGVHFDFVAY
ncbi:MAG: TonB C-terminal domain-containing protein [candidate division KSB1 bacterium]|nr:TonB C-terminal domain-containing protein [candidate division KSB1 bacterium]MDZ7304502.1 TonB C-terminal domain-containing protein [candidate division KSB1 bacterium]MDZ7313882.1 TonB C-terminal domain-containing protein [candidate division KSB1 bacterium]